MHIAIAWSHTDVILALLVVGANVNREDDTCFPALYLAVSNDYLQYGTNIHGMVDSGDTILTKTRNNIEFLSIVMFDFEANVNEKNNSGSTALH